MKVCPTCNEIYNDDDINFCLADGTTLLKKKGKKMPEHSYVNDVAAIIVAALALLVMLSLFTWSSTDSAGFWATGNGSPTHNWIGSVGAYISAFLFNAFGWTAYALPVLIGIIAWRVYRMDPLLPKPLRILGFVCFVLTLSGLLSLVFGYQAGAAVGTAVSGGIGYFLGSIGAGILLTAVFFCSVLLVTNFTLAWFLGHFDVAGQNLKIRYDEWRAKRREARSGEINAAKKRAEKRRDKREHVEEPASTPTIAPVEMAMAAAAAAGASEPLFSDDDRYQSIPTIDKSYETKKVPESEIEEALAETKPAEDEKAVETTPKDEPFTEDDSDEELSIPTSTQTFENYKLPDSSLLTEVPKPFTHKESELRETASMLAEKTAEFNVPGKVMHIAPGPVVTTFEFKPDAGVKYSRVTGLVDDLCLALKAPSIRIDRIPGKAHVGIEVPNPKREVIFLREVIESPPFKKSTSLLTLGLGKTSTLR